MVPLQEGLTPSDPPRAGDLVYHNAMRPPLLARRPALGWWVAALAALAFVILSLVVFNNPGFQAADAAAAQSIHTWAKDQSSPLSFTARAFSSWGRDGIALLMLLLVAGWARHGQRRELYLLVFGVGGVEVLFQLFSGLLGRERPDFKDPFETLIGFGYPSGHAATNVLLSMLVVYLLWSRIPSRRGRALLVIANVVVVLMVVLSRLFLGLHYPADIAAGVLLGVGWGALVMTLVDCFVWRPRPAASLARQYPGDPARRVPPIPDHAT